MRKFGNICRSFVMVGAFALAACQSGTEAEKSGPWTLNSEQSGMTYVTIKNGNLAEINTFRSISGSVTPEGQAEFTIDLNSLDTNNEIRDPRMKTIVFKTDAFPKATVTANVDMTPYKTLEIGDSYTDLLDMTLELTGTAWEQEVYVLVTRLGANKVVVANKAPLLLDASDFGYGEALETLKGLAGLNDITPIVPVTVSLVFER